MSEALILNSVGMMSPLGLNAASGCAAIRARLSRFEEIPFHDFRGHPIVASVAPEGATNQQGYKRLVRLLAGALRECTANRIERLARPDVPLLVVIGESERPDYPDRFSERLRDELQTILNVSLSAPFLVFYEGKAGVFRALDKARQLLQDRSTSACVVAAADSFINAKALDWLERHDKLKTEAQSDGVIPGEAAAALWVSRESTSDTALLEIIGLGFGEEETARTGEPNVAIGLTHALRDALKDAQLSCADVDFRVGGMTGEREEFMEASTAIARIQRVHKEHFELWVPAEMLGHVGAALGACMIVVTAMAMNRKYGPGRTAILFAGSYSPHRAACVVRAAKGVVRHG